MKSKERAFRKEFGNRLKNLRAELDLTQRQLALKCKLQPSAISRWENGDTLPTIFNTIIVAKGLGISVAEILDGIE